MKIKRTYPQPDSPQANIGPRERAMAVYRYMLAMEPEAAVKHSQFALLVAAFEQAERRGAREWAAKTPIDVRMVELCGGKLQMVAACVPPVYIPQPPDSIVPLLTGERDDPNVVVRPFTKDGL